MRKIGWRASCVCGLVAVSACSSSKKTFSTFTPVSQMVTASQGGTVTAANGAVVMVPPGAVQSDTVITMAPSATTPPSNVNQAGINVQFGPSGTQFGQPVTVKLPYDPSLIPSGAIVGVWTQEDQPGSPWQYIGGQPAGSGFFQTQTTHFSSCVVGTEPSSSGGGDGGSGGDCNSNAINGPVVQELQDASNPPAPQGGTMQNGTYYLTARTVYTGPGGVSGPTGRTSQTTVIVSNASTSSVSVQIAEQRNDPNNGTQTQRQNGTLAFSGTSFTATATCPANSQMLGGTHGFTATSTTFAVFSTDNGLSSIETYTRQ